MDAGTLGGKIGATEIAIESDCPVTFLIVFETSRWREIDDSVDQAVWVRVTPDERSRILHDGYEAR